MYSKLRKKYRKVFVIFFVVMLFLAGFSACLIFIPDNFSNLSPKSIASYSELRDSSSLTTIKYKPDLIIDTFEVDSFTKGFMVYDEEAEKYFAIYVPNEYAGEYEEELNKSLTSENYVPNVPEIYGTVDWESYEKLQEKFKNLVYNHIFNNTLIEYANASQINLETASEEELNALKEQVKKDVRSGGPLDWERRTNYPKFTVINYKSYKDRMKEGLLYPLSISSIALLAAILIITVLPVKYCKFKKIKNRIEENPNLKLNDIEQDFNNATNISNVWVGNKFIILLAFKNADIHLTENLAWTFAFRMKVRKAPDMYYLFTMDFDGNKNVTRIPRNKIIEILNLLENKCPNAYVGYNDDVLDIAIDSPNSLKKFNKDILDKSYVPTLYSINNLLK